MNHVTARQKILIVDDGRTDIDVLKDTLKGDYKLSIALNGPQAIESTQSGTLPDLIILDVMMPGMDGYAVCKWLKSNPLTREIPVIFLTAKAETVDEVLGFSSGAVDFINKPISPPVVRARVKTHLALRTAQQALVQQNKALLEAEQLRMDVEHITRHDMKTPINGILGIVYLLRDHTDLSLPDRRKTAVSSGLVRHVTLSTMYGHATITRFRRRGDIPLQAKMARISLSSRPPLPASPLIGVPAQSARLTARASLSRVVTSGS